MGLFATDRNRLAFLWIRTPPSVGGTDSLGDVATSRRGTHKRRGPCLYRRVLVPVRANGTGLPCLRPKGKRRGRQAACSM